MQRDGGMNPPNTSLTEFRIGEPARLEVMAAERAESPVTPFLLGKFTEHLGRNIYHGMWAQVLVNPGFEAHRFFVWDDSTPRDALAGQFTRGVPVAEATPLLDRLEEALPNGVAFGWMPHGEGEVRYALDADGVGAGTSQWIEARALTGSEVGIAQPIDLPLHRERQFLLSLYAKGDGPPLRVAISRAADGRPIAEGRTDSLGSEWQRHKVALTVDEELARGERLLLTLAIAAPGTVWLDQCFLFPADHVDGFDPDVLRLCREARLPLLRYPGGNFVSGYRWEEGVGPVDERPMRRNCAWRNVPEYHHVGTDEFMTFCRAVGCEPLICVNAGDGTPEEAARWVEYCNGDADTPMGRRRAENGHPEPYGVRLWEIGNEIWGDWQIGHTTRVNYAQRYRSFHECMRAVDPSILLIACGQDASWNEPLIERASDILRSLSIHTLIAHTVPAETPPETVFRSVMAFPVWYESHLSDLGRRMAKRVPSPRLAITELHVMRRSRPNHQGIVEALFLAGVINASIRLGELVEMITHTALVNHGGGLRKERETVRANPVHLAHCLYAGAAGRLPVRLRVTSPAFSVPALYDLPAVADAPYLDAVALLDAAGEELTLIVTNRHPTEAVPATIALAEFAAGPKVATETLACESFEAENTFEEPEAVRLERGEARCEAAGLTYRFTPHSLTRLVFRRAG
jgi:alpha-N-arabinofuranosidase